MDPKVIWRNIKLTFNQIYSFYSLQFTIYNLQMDSGKVKEKVIGQFQDCLTRQVSEGVSIRRSSDRVCNSKSEKHQLALWRVHIEIFHESFS